MIASEGVKRKANEEEPPEKWVFRNAGTNLILEFAQPMSDYHIKSSPEDYAGNRVRYLWQTKKSIPACVRGQLLHTLALLMSGIVILFGTACNYISGDMSFS